MRITHIEAHPVRIPLKPARHMITALGKLEQFHAGPQLLPLQPRSSRGC